MIEKEFEALDEAVLYKQMKVAEKQPFISVTEFKKELTRIRARK